ncbi:hypothetical protein HDU96_009918 [Phlyctochytrium bullatum]|nr:hypothetical protein HDU96_009918 [Phlyctochytrium bullatum]
MAETILLFITSVLGGLLGLQLGDYLKKQCAASSAKASAETTTAADARKEADEALDSDSTLPSEDLKAYEEARAGRLGCDDALGELENQESCSGDVAVDDYSPVEDWDSDADGEDRRGVWLGERRRAGLRGHAARNFKKRASRRFQKRMAKMAAKKNRPLPW